MGGLQLSLNRRIASTALGAYLGLTMYHSVSRLSAVFTCETRGEDVRTRLNALVIDGPTTGVLRELPTFDRLMIHIDAAKGTAKVKYLLSNIHLLRLESNYCKLPG